MATAAPTEAPRVSSEQPVRIHIPVKIQIIRLSDCRQERSNRTMKQRPVEPMSMEEPRLRGGGEEGEASFRLLMIIFSAILLTFTRQTGYLLRNLRRLVLLRVLRVLLLRGLRDASCGCMTTLPAPFSRTSVDKVQHIREYIYQVLLIDYIYDLQSYNSCAKIACREHGKTKPATCRLVQLPGNIRA